MNQVLKHIYRIDEMRDGCVYATSFVEQKWIDQIDGETPNTPDGFIYASPSTTTPFPWIRAKRCSFCMKLMKTLECDCDLDESDFEYNG